MESFDKKCPTAWLNSASSSSSKPGNCQRVALCEGVEPGGGWGVTFQITLEQAHMRTRTSVPLVGRATEEGMWSYAVQLSSTLRAAHSAGLVRCAFPRLSKAMPKPATRPWAQTPLYDLPI